MISRNRTTKKQSRRAAYASKYRHKRFASETAPIPQLLEALGPFLFTYPTLSSLDKRLNFNKVSGIGAVSYRLTVSDIPSADAAVNAYFELPVGVYSIFPGQQRQFRVEVLNNKNQVIAFREQTLVVPKGKLRSPTSISVNGDNEDATLYFDNPGPVGVYFFLSRQSTTETSGPFATDTSGYWDGEVGFYGNDLFASAYAIGNNNFFQSDTVELPASLPPVGGFPPYGEPASDPYCINYDLSRDFHNGDGGIYSTILEYNSVTCGYDDTVGGGGQSPTTTPSLSVDQTRTDGVTISVGSSDGADQIVFEFSNDSISWAVFTTLPAYGGTVNIDGLSSGTTYYVRAEGTNQYGGSGTNSTSFQTNYEF